MKNAHGTIGKPAAILLVLFAASSLGFERVQVEGPARLEIRADSPADTIALADLVHVTLSVHGRPGLEVQAPRRVAADWVLVEREDAVFQEREGHWQQAYVLAPIAPGPQALAIAPWRYRTAGSDWQTVTWRPVPVVVTTTVAKPDPRSLRDAISIERAPPPSARSDWLAPLAVAVVALLVPLAAMFLWRRPRRRARQAGQEAARLCARLRAGGLLQRGQPEPYVAVLTLILRRYLDRRFGLQTRRMTAAEAIHAVQSAPGLTEPHARLLAEVLERSELIKFAGITPAAAECERMAENVQRFIQDTA